jgi:hypothetical protein
MSFPSPEHPLLRPECQNELFKLLKDKIQRINCIPYLSILGRPNLRYMDERFFYDDDTYIGGIGLLDKEESTKTLIVAHSCYFRLSCVGSVIDIDVFNRFGRIENIYIRTKTYGDSIVISQYKGNFDTYTMPIEEFIRKIDSKTLQYYEFSAGDVFGLPLPKLSQDSIYELELR